jgi:hypothetical protein
MLYNTVDFKPYTNISKHDLEKLGSEISPQGTNYISCLGFITPQRVTLSK